MQEKNNNYSLLSIISLLISILGFALFVIILQYHLKELKTLFVIIAIISIILPLISKRIRIDLNKSGKGAEIAALVLGGYNFYCIIFAFTNWPLYMAYLGWVIAGIVYCVTR